MAPSAAQQLRGFIAKFAPEHQRLIRGVHAALQARMPAATQLVYDNYNFFVIAFSPTERPADIVLSIAAAANGVSLYFVRGATLSDPQRLLHGAGKQMRFLRVESIDVLDRPAVRKLLAATVTAAGVPFPKRGRGPLVIRSVSAKQRPRRPVAR